MSFMLHSGSYFKRKMSDIPSDEEITTPDTSESSSTLSDYEVAAALKRQKCTTTSPDHVCADFSGGSFAEIWEQSTSTATETTVDGNKQPTTPKRNVTFADESSFKYYDAPDLLNGFPGVESLSIDTVVEAYKQSCCENHVPQSNYIIHQLRDMNRNDDYSGRLNLIMPINFANINTLELIFSKANFSTIYLNNSKYLRECSIIILQIIEYYKPTKELYLTEHEDNFSYWDTFGHMVKNNHTLTTIGFCEINVGNDTSYKVYSKLNLNQNIKAIRFDACQLMSAPTFNIETTNITELHICYCNLLPRHAAVIAEHLEKNNQLTILDLSYNKLEDVGFLMISKVIYNRDSHSSTITELIMVENYLTNKCSLTANFLLFYCAHLKILNLGKNNLGDMFLAEIRDSLMGNTSLEGLGLQSTNLTGEGLQILKDILLTNSTIVHINLQNNFGILPEYIQEFSVYVQQTSLVQLDLNTNNGDFYEEICDVQRVLTLHRHLWEVVNNQVWVPKRSLSCETEYIPTVPVEKKKSRTRFAVTRVSEAGERYSSVIRSRFTVQAISDNQVPSTSSAAVENVVNTNVVSGMLTDIVENVVLSNDGEAPASSDEHETSFESDVSENQNLSHSTSSWDEE